MSIKKNLIFFTFLAGLLVFSSCSKDDDMTTDNTNDDITTDCIQGEGTITTSTLSVADFTGIDLTMSSNVTINQGTIQKVEATGHPNIIDLVSTTVSNGIWEIRLQGSNCIEDFQLYFVITVPNINQLTVSGSGNLAVNDFSDQGGLTIDVSGSGNLTLNNFEGITDLDVTLDGSGNVSGNKDISTLETLNVNNNGSGNYLGFDISSNDCTINSSGLGNCEVTVQNALNVTINGIGNVSYKGMPTITQNITGLGKLIDAN